MADMENFYDDLVMHLTKIDFFLPDLMEKSRNGIQIMESFDR